MREDIKVGYLVDESKIHEHLDHHAKRFEVTKLEDVKLRHIVRGRVLRVKNASAVQAAVSSLSERHQKGAETGIVASCRVSALHAPLQR